MGKDMRKATAWTVLAIILIIIMYGSYLAGVLWFVITWIVFCALVILTIICIHIIIYD